MPNTDAERIATLAALALHESLCADDDCDGSDMGSYEQDAAHVAAVLTEAGVGFVAEAEDNTQRLVDHCVHYRNLAISFGAKPEQMLSEFDRNLATNHAADMAENFDFDTDSTEAWELAERAEAALADLRERVRGFLNERVFWQRPEDIEAWARGLLDEGADQ